MIQACNLNSLIELQNEFSPSLGKCVRPYLKIKIAVGL